MLFWKRENLVFRNILFFSLFFLFSLATGKFCLLKTENGFSSELSANPPQPVFNKNSGLNETMFIRIGKVRLLVEIADTPRKRAVGLMYRESLPEDKGMLFVFPEEDYLSFWMKNTKIPLSVGYFDKNGILLEIYNMEPNRTDVTYPSFQKALYALEVNQGWFEKNGITKGAVLILERAVSGK